MIHRSAVMEEYDRGELCICGHHFDMHDSHHGMECFAASNADDRHTKYGDFCPCRTFVADCAQGLLIV